jgi:hypothetical protein
VTALENIVHQQAVAPGRVILIWIGPAWPLLYNNGFPPDDDGLKRRLFDNLVGVSSALREAQVSLDMLTLSLQALAHQSGGQLLVKAEIFLLELPPALPTPKTTTDYPSTLLPPQNRTNIIRSR